ncbi:efflux RND transporter periplasmic adaptor subunit [Dechloromonas sp. ZY10]|uniref:efflux RND transporter periplasmic adaptor subunit n=1 Tax=Dechloromonas aquae TaxID=2664436 RepID=UPI003527D528
MRCLFFPSRLLLPALGTLILLPLFGGCTRQEAPPSGPRTVLVQAAGEEQQSISLYSGEIRARHEFDLAFRVGGKIAARLVDAGAEVRPGQPLARLDPADLQLAASAAAAQLASAESEHATARAERERYAGLLSKNFVSPSAFETRDNAANAARARLDQARAQARISGNQASYGSLSSEAPAVVTAVLAEAGQVVAAGQPVLRLARPEQKEVAIAVPEGRVAELRASKQFTVNLWANPKISLRGELRELAPAADPQTRSYAARIRLIDPPPEVSLGMTASVRVSAAGQPGAGLLLPLPAVINQGQGAIVRVVVAGKVVSRPVTVAAYEENGVRIASGLQPGELVVIAGAARLAEGEAVEPKTATPPAQQR